MDKAALITIFYILRVILDVLLELTVAKATSTYDKVKEASAQVDTVLEALFSDDEPIN